jgi:hypothetical protein
MDSYSERIAVSRGTEANGFGSCQTYNLSSRQEEDRVGAAGEVGEAKGGAEEEGGLIVRGACCQHAAGFRTLMSAAQRFQD